MHELEQLYLVLTACSASTLGLLLILVNFVECVIITSDLYSTVVAKFLFINKWFMVACETCRWCGHDEFIVRNSFN